MLGDDGPCSRWTIPAPLSFPALDDLARCETSAARMCMGSACSGTNQGKLPASCGNRSPSSAPESSTRFSLQPRTRSRSRWPPAAVDRGCSRPRASARTRRAALVLFGVLLLAYAFQCARLPHPLRAHYSDRSMSTVYLLTSLWGGQDGSLLLVVVPAVRSTSPRAWPGSRAATASCSPTSSRR